MSRISIDVTPQEHQRLKAMAALQGKSIKQFVLASTIGTPSAEAALAELEALLDQRAQEADAAGASPRGVGDVFRHAREEASRAPDAGVRTLTRSRHGPTRDRALHDPDLMTRLRERLGGAQD